MSVIISYPDFLLNEEIKLQIMLELSLTLHFWISLNSSLRSCNFLPQFKLISINKDSLKCYTEYYRTYFKFLIRKFYCTEITFSHCIIKPARGTLFNFILITSSTRFEQQAIHLQEAILLYMYFMVCIMHSCGLAVTTIELELPWKFHYHLKMNSLFIRNTQRMLSEQNSRNCISLVLLYNLSLCTVNIISKFQQFICSLFLVNSFSISR